MIGIKKMHRLESLRSHPCGAYSTAIPVMPGALIQSANGLGGDCEVTMVCNCDMRALILLACLRQGMRGWRHRLPP
jgi:hypothetical protein